MSGDLFASEGTPERSTRAPLADRMRPADLDEVVGQAHLVGRGRPLRLMAEAGELSSLVLWGPPGSGKTTLARLLAAAAGRRSVAYSAVTSGVADIRKVVAQAVEYRRAGGPGTVLFVDELHRFNKAQQDAFLPHVESGLVTLLGATTENPSFEVNAALLSRMQVFVLEPLADEDVAALVERAARDRERGLGKLEVVLPAQAVAALTALAGGDGRVALNLLEAAALSTPARPRRLDAEFVQTVAGRPAIRHDKAGDRHYDLVSALIKSVRGSDPDAALYWLARMLEGGEEPRYIARRLVILASEDVGNADPAALPLAVAAFQAAHAIGMPEAGLVLSQATLYLARAPKSNEVLVALERAREDARRTPGVPVPLHLRQAATPLLRELGAGKGYRYPHAEDASDQGYLPEALSGRRYVGEPGEGGS